jgi:hypothetical protein
MSTEVPAPAHLDAVLDGLAANPALPTALLRRLLAHRRGFGQAAKRPDLTADLIAEIIATDHHWLLHSLALNPALPDTVRLQLTGHHDPGVRAALVVGARNACRGVFERLIDDPDKRVREHLAQGDTVRADLRARLAHDPDPEIRAALARWWPQAPEHVRRILLIDPVAKVRAAACSTYYARLPHPIPPADLVPSLLNDPVTRAGAVRHADLTPQTAARLANDPDNQVRRELAAHPQLPADLRDRLADDPSAYVRVGIFARPDTPEPVRQRIYTGVQKRSRHLADELDDDLDDDAVIQTFIDEFAGTELRALRLAWVTADGQRYVTSPYVCFRASAACSPSLPPEAVARLLNDEDSIVRTTMASHAPHLVDTAAAERIDREYLPDKKTRWRPADDFVFPPDTLRRFATDPDPRMRCLAPRDPNLPAELAERLAADTEASVRHAIATHPRLPTHALIALLADPSQLVARTAAASPSLPVADMERLLLLAGL